MQRCAPLRPGKGIDPYHVDEWLNLKVSKMRVESRTGQLGGVKRTV
jgi:hypothetical protein